MIIHMYIIQSTTYHKVKSSSVTYINKNLFKNIPQKSHRNQLSTLLSSVVSSLVLIPHPHYLLKLGQLSFRFLSIKILWVFKKE